MNSPNPPAPRPPLRLTDHKSNPGTLPPTDQNEAQKEITEHMSKTTLAAYNRRRAAAFRRFAGLPITSPTTTRHP